MDDMEAERAGYLEDFLDGRDNVADRGEDLRISTLD